jgi:hypothetical protein
MVQKRQTASQAPVLTMHAGLHTLAQPHQDPRPSIASVSIVPFTASYLSGRNVVTRPFRSGFRFEIVAARPNHHQQSRLCREFIGIMIDLLKQQAAASIM